MKFLIILSACIAVCLATGPYSFGYSTADGQSRQETGHGGAVTGSYSYVDANGDLRQVRYVADALGYRAEGDVSVDKRTALAAAALEAIAPKGTVPVGVVAPVRYAAWGHPAQYAAPIAANLAVPVNPWAVIGHRGYRVETPTHSINFQI